MKVEKKVIRLFDMGHQPSDIAKRLGISSQAVDKVLRETFEPQPATEE